MGPFDCTVTIYDVYEDQEKVFHYTDCVGILERDGATTIIEQTPGRLFRSVNYTTDIIKTIKLKLVNKEK